MDIVTFNQDMGDLGYKVLIRIMDICRYLSVDLAYLFSQRIVILAIRKRQILHDGCFS